MPQLAAVSLDITMMLTMSVKLVHTDVTPVTPSTIAQRALAIE
jgi:hypothetical protein